MMYGAKRVQERLSTFGLQQWSSLFFHRGPSTAFVASSGVIKVSTIIRKKEVT
jgi:hypothetical protein